MRTVVPEGLVIPERVGNPEVLARKFGRELRIQRYRHPDGRVDKYSMLHADVYPSIILPVTDDRNVVAQWEFRYGVGQQLLEVPGGKGKPGQIPEEVARQELLEEIGYIPGQLVLLNDRVFPDPATLTFAQALFLAKDCIPAGERKPERGEYIEIVLIPLAQWLEMIWSGEIKDQKTIAVTMLALPHLGVIISGA